MPVYDYDCEACGRRFEVTHGVHADGPLSCPLCGGGPVRKAISAPAIHYKGSGWAKKERRATSTPSDSKSTADTSTGDGAGSKASGTATDSTSSTKTSESGPASPAD